MSQTPEAKTFAREIDYWSKQGLTLKEITAITNIPYSVVNNRHQLKKCAPHNAERLAEARDALAACVSVTIEKEKKPKEKAPIYEESGAPERCQDPSPLRYMQGCKCKDCYYLARTYVERRRKK